MRKYTTKIQRTNKKNRSVCLDKPVRTCRMFLVITYGQ